MSWAAANGGRLGTAAIVTTLRNTGPVLDSFIGYHLAIGFEHLFLFFDDADDPSIALAAERPNVTVTRHDQALRERWRRSDAYRRSTVLKTFLDVEVMARQVLNVEVAIDMARRREIDWLLHIDADELFYPRSMSVRDHFARLTRRGLLRVSYLNYEAIPETADVDDFFREVTLFKRNPAVVGRKLKRAKVAQEITAMEQLPHNFFHFYSNGKPAARLRPGLMATGVHGFRQEEEGHRRVQLCNLIASSPLARAAVKAFPPLTAVRSRGLERVAKVAVRADPAILHYPCCGFENFWTKYQTLGHFADTWFERDDIVAKIGSFHLEARDVVLTGDRRRAAEFYERRVLIRDRATVERLRRYGLVEVITTPREVLEGRHETGPA